MKTSQLRLARTAAAVLTAAALTVGATACNDDDGGSGGNKAGGSSTSGGADKDNDSDSDSDGDSDQADGQDTGGAKASDGASKQTTGGSSTGGGTQNAAVGTCTMSSLRIAMGTASGHGQATQPVTMTNTGGASCALTGYPGVDLVGTDGTSWSLVRAKANPVKQVLKPGGSTSFDITFLVAVEGEEGAWKVASAKVTPPNLTQSVTLPWTAAPVTKQDAATHPGTYVGPVGG